MMYSKAMITKPHDAKKNGTEDCSDRSDAGDWNLQIDASDEKATHIVAHFVHEVMN